MVLAYLVLTLLIVFFTYTKAANPDAMIWGRIRIAVITVALWGVYRMLPCRLHDWHAWWCRWRCWAGGIRHLRDQPHAAHLDHVFAQWEQDMFGCQPALLFCKAMPWPVVSELMDMGYAAYYPMIALVVLYYFAFRYHEFERASFVVLTAFFIYYVVFVLVPVTGPTFYYKAAGLTNIANGVFPNVHDYFNYYQDCLPSPGYKDGIFYHFVEDAKAAGERPTAAFPSSHVGISTVLMLLVWHSGNRRLLYVLLPFYVLLCLATVYIQAHYAIDALAGLVSGALLYVALMAVSRKMVTRQ